MKTIVYIDGFNLYYGVRDTPCRWLDLHMLAKRLLPRDEILGIKYFTALVNKRNKNSNKQEHQKTYLRALQTLPNLSIYYGHFLTSQVWAQRVHPPRVGKARVKVWKTEEKGSDVNIATQLLVDGFHKNYELAVVLSNDGDLKHPVEYVRHELQLPVGILNPQQKRSYALSPSKLPRKSFYKPIRMGALAASQFSPALTDAEGSFTKPVGW